MSSRDDLFPSILHATHKQGMLPVLESGFPVVLSADLPIDAVGDDSDDDDLDDGNNGDFEEVTVEPFVQVARGRSSNHSRSASPSTSHSSISSGPLLPPTPISNVFEPLAELSDFMVREAQNSWDFRRHILSEDMSGDR